MGRTIYIEGVAFWAPHLPGWERASAVLAGREAPATTPAARPSPSMLAATERRRAPDTVAIALEVAARACEHAGRDPKTLSSVFASTHGDLAVTDYMCETLAKTPLLTSPTKFHNSVHNAAAGYWSIATGCMKPYTAVSAYQHSFGAGLLEAAVQVCTLEEAVLFVAYDIAARGPLGTMAESSLLLGCALVLSPDSSAASRAQLQWQTQHSAQPQPSNAANAALVLGSPMAGCLPLFEALANNHAAQLRLQAGRELEILLRVAPLMRAGSIAA
jgi:hypothetical protein